MEKMTNEQLLCTLKELAQFMVMKDEAEGHIKRLQGLVKGHMGDETLLAIDQYKVIYKTQVAEKFDSKKFKQDHPDVYKLYTMQSVSRPFRMTR